MAENTVPKKNVAYTFYVALVATSNRPDLQANPTLAAGDAQVSTDGGAFGNLGTLPVVTPASGVAVKVVLSASEMNGDNLTVKFIDAAGGEWDDLFVEIRPATRKLEDLAWPTITGRSLDVAATGEAGLDFGNAVGSITGAEIGIGAFASAAITADAIAADAIGSSELATDAIGDAQIATGAIASTAFAAGAIDAAAIATGAIDADAIATDAITATKIAANAIGASELAADAIGDSQIATGAIASTAFAAGAINAAAIATDAITAAKIAADAIGASELAADAVTEIRDAITGGAYAMDTDANGRVRIVDGTSTGELDTLAGKVLIQGTINDLDSLNDIAAADVWTSTPRTLTAIGTGVIDATARNEIADSALVRDIVNVEGTAAKHSLATSAMVPLKSAISGATLTVTKPGGGTMFTFTVVVDATADPITGIS